MLLFIIVIIIVIIAEQNQLQSLFPDDFSVLLCHGSVHKEEQNKPLLQLQTFTVFI